MTELTFLAPGQPMSENEARGRHWGRVKRALAPWQSAAWATSHNALVQRHLTPDVPITVQVVLPFRVGRRRDPHNYTGTVVKAIVDGLVKAQVVPDDTPDWVTVLDSELIVVPKAAPLTVTIRINPRSTP